MAAYNPSMSDVNLGRATTGPYDPAPQQRRNSAQATPAARYAQQVREHPYDAPAQRDMAYESPYARPADARGPPPGFGAPPPKTGAPYAQGPDGAPLGTYDPPTPSGMSRRRTRSLSPTPTEIAEINRPLYDFSHFKSKDYWLQWRLVPWYIGGLIGLTCFTLLTIYHKQIVDYLKPAAEWMRDLKFGYLIPVAIFFVISFPPLFGHEIVAVICGLVWGLGIGFAITCAGTLIGEIGNYYAFKYCCRARAEKLEKEKPYYDCLARVVRDGGFKVALVARLSAIPGHFTTAIFATCGMNIWVFILAAILSLPKQFITVYAGVMIKESEDGQQKEGKTQSIISKVVAVLSVIITFVAVWWIYRQMQIVKPIVFRERRLARLAKMNAAKDIEGGDFSTNSTRVGTGRFDKYGGSMVADPDGARGGASKDAYEMEMRGRKERFAANARRGGDGDESIESGNSDAPLNQPAMKVEYGSYMGVDDQRSRGHALSPTDQGYASPGQQYGGPYSGDVNLHNLGQQTPAKPPQQQYHHHTGKLQKKPPPGAFTASPYPASASPVSTISRNAPQVALPPLGSPIGLHDPTTPLAPPPQIQGGHGNDGSTSAASTSTTHTFYPPSAPPPGAGFARPGAMVAQVYPRPPPQDQYRGPQQEQPQRQREESEDVVLTHAFAPTVHRVEPTEDDDGGHGEVPAALVAGPRAAPSPTPAAVPAIIAPPPPSGSPAGGAGHPRKESSHTREATEYRRGGRGGHAAEATAYYSADEGDDGDDGGDQLAYTQSKMPGQLFREQSEPAPGWAR